MQADDFIFLSESDYACVREHFLVMEKTILSIPLPDLMCLVRYIIVSTSTLKDKKGKILIAGCMIFQV